MRSVAVDMEPIQDLHGQANPYPAGGGVNLLPPMVDGTYEGNGVKAVVSGGVATLSGTTNAGGNALVIPLSQSVTIPNGSYFHMLNSVANASVQPSFEDSNNVSGTSMAITLSPQNHIVAVASSKYGVTINRVRFYLSSGVTLSGTFSPMLCLTDTATTYAPYSNICPISGRSEVGVWRSGKNLLEGVTNDLISISNNAASVINGTGTCLIAHVVEGQTYTFSNANINRNVVSYWDALPSVGDSTSYYQVQERTFTALKTGLVLIYIYNAATDTSTAQIELGSTVTAYEAPNIQHITVQLGQTVYGGTVDAVSGVLTVDRAMVTYDGSDDENWETGTGRFVITIDDIRNINARNEIIANIGYYSASSATDGVGAMFAFAKKIYYYAPTSITTATEFREWLSSNNLSVVYYLATPLTIQLSAQQLTTLKGLNNVWSDADSVSVEYAINTKTYIDDTIQNSTIQSNAVRNIVVLTQAQYDALTTKDANTEYNIIGE